MQHCSKWNAPEKIDAGNVASKSESTDLPGSHKNETASSNGLPPDFSQRPPPLLEPRDYPPPSLPQQRPCPEAPESVELETEFPPEQQSLSPLDLGDYDLDTSSIIEIPESKSDDSTFIQIPDSTSEDSLLELDLDKLPQKRGFPNPTLPPKGSGLSGYLLPVLSEGIGLRAGSIITTTTPLRQSQCSNPTVDLLRKLPSLIKAVSRDHSPGSLYVSSEDLRVFSRDVVPILAALPYLLQHQHK